jgi:hypothetical protein
MQQTKMNKLTNGFMAISLVLLAGCAEGYESPTEFDLGVRNTQVKTPPHDSISFKLSTDGKTATVSWPTVAGANGHQVTFMNVDDPDNPFVVDGYENKIVDGSKFTVAVTEDSKYMMTMRTLGNKDYGNSDADSTMTYNFSTLVPSVMTIPSGEEISAYIAAHPLDTAGIERAIELEPDGEYTLNGVVDFGCHNITLRGDKIHRPVVHLEGDGHIETYCGLKVKYINFDLSESTAQGFIAMTKNNLPDSIKTENRGGGTKYMRNGSVIKGIYMVEEPIYVANCWFKNLPHAMLYDNGISVAYWNFTLSDCIVQMNNVTKSNIGFINLYTAGKSVKNIRIERSTIYNIVDNSSACFIRYNNESASQPDKVYGNVSADMNSHSWNFSQSTFSKTYTGWRFVNNVRVTTAFTLSVDHCIFYDVAQLYRMDSGSKTYRFNFVWSPRADDISRNNNMKDSGSAPFASVYDPLFKGDVMQEIDFTQPNGGLNFTPGEYELVFNRGGDPRWLPAADVSED